MNCEIIAVGSELTTGDIANTNAAFLSAQLTELGITVTRQTAVDDNPRRIVEALTSAVNSNELVIFTGGLGPTPDDLTKETVSKAIGLRLIKSNESLERIKSYFDKRGREMTDNNRKQAYFPEGATIFPNPTGTADGCAVESDGQYIIMLPGPPSELKSMFEDSVCGFLSAHIDSFPATCTLKVYGMGESAITEKLDDLLWLDDPVVATYIGRGGDIRIKITSNAESKEKSLENCEKTAKIIKHRLGSLIYDYKGRELSDIVVDKLKQKNMKIATAESCTAGLLSKTLTDIAGASEVFEYGISAYANRIKTEMLGVPAELIEEKSAVSPEVARAMAMGARRNALADIGVGITGYAGPDSAPGEPVGLVYICLCDGKKYYDYKLLAPQNKGRDAIREIAVMTSLNMIRLYLDHDPNFLSGGTETGKKSNEDLFTGEDIYSNSSDLPLDDAAALAAAGIVADEMNEFAELDDLAAMLSSMDGISPAADEAVLSDLGESVQPKAGELPAESTPDVMSESSHAAIDEAAGAEPEPVSEIDALQENASAHKPTETSLPESHARSDNNPLPDGQPPIFDQLPEEEPVGPDHTIKEYSRAAAPKPSASNLSESPKKTDGDFKLSSIEGISAAPHENKTSQPPKKHKKTFKEFWQGILPWKGDKPAEKIRKLILIICVLVFIGSATYIVDYFVDSILNKIKNNHIAELISQNGSLDENGINTNFYPLLEINPDTVGWLRIPNTQTNNPVVKTTDNSKYLNTTFEGEHSKYGTIFADKDNVFGVGDQNSQNIVLYGHHMKDGSMMGELKKYRTLDFYKENPAIEFNTLHSPTTTYWKIFSIFIINSDSVDDNGHIFNYTRTDFGSETDFMSFIDETYQRSIITTANLDVEFSDSILTLSTCVYDFHEARLVVMARKCRAGESSQVDTTNAIYNPDPVYPQGYYDKTGKSGRTRPNEYTAASSNTVSVSSQPRSASDLQSSFVSRVISYASPNTPGSSSRPAFSHSSPYYNSATGEASYSTDTPVYPQPDPPAESDPTSDTSHDPDPTPDPTPESTSDPAPETTPEPEPSPETPATPVE